jgi:hypothetical protein
MGHEMSTDDRNRATTPRREKATRGAFYIWMAAYAAALVAIATVHGLGPAPAPEMHDQQATRGGTLIGPLVPILRAGANG